MKQLTLFASLALLLTACNTASQATPSPSSDPVPPLLGVLRVDLSGLGSAFPQVKGQFVSPKLGLSSQTLDYVNPSGLSVGSGWVSFDDDDLNNVRYLKTVLRLKNTSSSSLKNLTLHALSLSTGGSDDTLGGTGVSNLRDAAGNPITDPNIARGMQPTHAMNVGFAGAFVSPEFAHLQAYTVAEATQTQTLYTTAVSGGGGKVLGYGFTSSASPGSRDIASGSTAQVALAYRLPKTNPRAQNPWSLRLYFLVTTDTETSVTQSLEEQGDNAGVVARAGGISATRIRILAGSTLPDSRASLVYGGAYALNPTTSVPEKWLSDPALSVGSGKLDAFAFGNGGKVTTPIGSGTDTGSAVAVQSDGKIVVAGSSFNGSNDDFAVVRFNTDGSLDTGFGLGGKVTTSIGLSNDEGKALVLQSDGKIVVAGESKIGTYLDFAVVRFNTNGSLDTSFGTGGKVTTSIGSSDDRGNAVALQSDGKIVVVGSSKNPDGSIDFAVVRYNASGSLDTSFGPAGVFGAGGLVTTSITGRDSGTAVALQSNGKIVVGGSSFLDTGLGQPFKSAVKVVRYNTNGSLDNSFGTGGIASPIPILADGNIATEDTCNALALQIDGKVVVAGFIGIGSTSRFFGVKRLNTDGNLDTNFGTGGRVNTSISSSKIDGANALVLQSDGKIVVAGYTYNLPNNNIAVVRYTPNGSLDTGFGNVGKVTTSIGLDSSVGNAVALQSDGKIVVAGTSSNGSNTDFAVVRYQP